jgi:hypothetical protein
MNQEAVLMDGVSKMAKDLERLKRRIRAGEKSLKESASKAERLDATIQAEIRSRQSVKSKRKNK